MRIEFMWKDDQSRTGGCASLSKAPGGYVVNGRPVSGADAEQIPERSAGEVAVFVPANVLDRLRETE